MLEVHFGKQLESYTLDMAFSAAPGITALFGPSGAGKSMLAKMLGGLETPDFGQMSLSGRVLYRKNDGSGRSINIPAHKRQIGFVFQDHRLFPHYTALGNLKYGMAGSRSRLQIEEVIAFLGVEALLSRKPATLSGGEQQRIAIGRALLSSPDLLIMDEPLSSLDAARKGEVLTLIESLRDRFDQNILYISHSMSEVMRLADQVLLLDRGTIVAAGDTAEILSRHDLYPFTGGADAGTVIEATVIGHDARFNLIRLDSGIGSVSLPKMHGVKTGDSIRLHIRARDVALSTEDINHISILNRFKGVIQRITPGQAGMVDVTLDAGLPLTARITEKSLEQLQLQVGKPVWALVKSVTVNSVEYHQA